MQINISLFKDHNIWIGKATGNPGALLGRPEFILADVLVKKLLQLFNDPSVDLSTVSIMPMAAGFAKTALAPFGLPDGDSPLDVRDRGRELAEQLLNSGLSEEQFEGCLEKMKKEYPLLHAAVVVAVKESVSAGEQLSASQNPSTPIALPDEKPKSRGAALASGIGMSMVGIASGGFKGAQPVKEGEYPDSPLAAELRAAGERAQISGVDFGSGKSSTTVAVGEGDGVVVSAKIVDDAITTDRLAADSDLVAAQAKATADELKDWASFPAKTSAELASLGLRSDGMTTPVVGIAAPDGVTLPPEVIAPATEEAEASEVPSGDKKAEDPKPRRGRPPANKHSSTTETTL